MSVRKAAVWVNAHDQKLAKHRLLSKDTLRRYCKALPAALRDGTDGQLLEWMQAYDGQRRRVLSAASSGSRLFTPLEEELIAQWVCVMARVNLGVGKADVIQRARELMLQRKGLLPEDVERIKA